MPFTSAPRDYIAPLPLDLLFLIEVTLCFFYDNGYKDVIKSYNVIMPSEPAVTSLRKLGDKFLFDCGKLKTYELCIFNGAKHL